MPSVFRGYRKDIGVKWVKQFNNFNPTLPDPRRKEKINLGTQRSVKLKIEVNYYFNHTVHYNHLAPLAVLFCTCPLFCNYPLADLLLPAVKRC